MTFTNTRGIYSVSLNNGIDVLSIRDYAFMVRDTVKNVQRELALDEIDVADFVYINREIDDDDNVLLGVQYHTLGSGDRTFAIIGCKKDTHCTEDEMYDYLLNQ